MANIETRDHWQDLGRLVSKKKVKVMDRIVWEYIFEEGKLVSGEKL